MMAAVETVVGQVLDLVVVVWLQPGLVVVVAVVQVAVIEAARMAGMERRAKEVAAVTSC
jgi:hypothetical protein